MDIPSTKWLPVVCIILILAYKNLPFMWHVRFIRALVTRLFLSPITEKELNPECLFLPAIHRTRSPLTECDYNIHKSNSTYFTDLDISRGNLSLLLFSQRLSFQPTSTTAVMILSGVQCVFRREIKPYQPYEVWSRVLSWDEKWIYILSHFVERGAVRHKKYLLQPKKHKDRCSGNKSQSNQAHKVFASAVSRYVFKQGRKTFPPEKMLIECGLLPAKRNAQDSELDRVSEESDYLEEVGEKKSTWRSIEERRKRDLDTVQLKLGWDAVHNCFDGDDSAALGRYTDLIWR